MATDPNPVKRSHKKNRRKVADLPHPTDATCETPAVDVALEPMFGANIVTQPTQAPADNATVAATSLLALSSTPGRPLPHTLDTQFNSGIASVAEAARASPLVNRLYPLGLQTTHPVAPIGNTPRVFFGSQVSPPAKRPRLSSPPIEDPSCHLLSAAAAVVDPPMIATTNATPTVDFGTLPKHRAASITVGSANLLNFNKSDRVTTLNRDHVMVLLRKLSVPVYNPNAKRRVPNPLISVQSSSLPLKQDTTTNSCANLVKRIRNPLNVRATPANTNDATLNARQRRILDATTKRTADWKVHGKAVFIDRSRDMLLPIPVSRTFLDAQYLV